MSRLLRLSMVAATGLAAAARSSAAAADDGSMNYMRSFGPAADPVTALELGADDDFGCGMRHHFGAGVVRASFASDRPCKPARTGACRWARPAAAWRGSTSASVFPQWCCSAARYGRIFTLSAVAAPRRRADAHAGGDGPPVVVGSALSRATCRSRCSPPPTKSTSRSASRSASSWSSGDVIHSFWVPQLAGKTDMIPGQTNHAWLQADTARRSTAASAANTAACSMRTWRCT